MAAIQESVGIGATPASGQMIEHDGKKYTTIREGEAYILVPPNARTSVNPQAKLRADDGSQNQNVFYNPIQQFNRDLSVLAIKAFGEDMCRKKRLKHDLQKQKGKQRQERKRQRQTTNKETGGGEVGEEKLKRKREGRDDDREVKEPAKLPRREDAVAPAVENGDVEQDNDGAELPGTEPGSEATGAATLSTNGTQQGDTSVQEHATYQPWQPRFRILDALSATGLRALRYASEIPFATSIVANDRDEGAVKSIKLNAEHNNLALRVDAIAGDAIGHMYSVAYPLAHTHGPHHKSGKYDVIDLDPYGTAAPFIDSALQALEDGGLLCVTCTDSGVWASCGYSEKTYSLYGGMPIKNLHSHEGGLRLILHSVATAAARYGLSIEPLLSLSIDFYARLFIRIRKSPNEVKFLAGKTMLVYGCDVGCGAWKTQFIGRHQKHKNSETNWKYSIALAPNTDSLCEHCGSKTHIAGPMWGGPLHNAAFVERILTNVEKLDPEIYQTKPRIEGMLDTALGELSVNPEVIRERVLQIDEDENDTREIIPSTPPQHIDHHPFYFVPSALCKVIKAQAPPDDMLKSALRHAGYIVTRSHCKAGSFKTDAPWTVIWEVLREWVRQKAPVKEDALKEGQAGWKIMQAMRKSDQELPGNVSAVENGTPESTLEIATKDSPHVTRNKPVDPKRMAVVFDKKLGDDKPGRRLVRYQQNPRDNWGPMVKAKGSTSNNTRR